ncbi:Wzz/FepE/Etk N-terminal domain-containing protein [Janthinobacterium sp. CG_23.3]
MQTIAATADESVVESELDLIDLLIVLAKHKKMIIFLPLAVAILALAVSFLLPNIYKANTKILPPQQGQSGAAALLSQLGGVAGAAAGAAGMKNPNDLYVGMLTSRTIADRLIARYDLKKAYATDSQEKARKILEDNTSVVAGKDGLISVEVEGKDKLLVSKLANSYAEELLKLTKVLAVTEAAQRRLFFERQLELSKDNLSKAEMTLKSALDTHGVISVDSDSRAIVETVGRLRAQIAAKEIQLNSMQAFVTPNNHEYKRVQEDLSSLRSEFSKLQNGRPALAGDEMPAGDKQAGLENIKILREVKYHQMLYELLSKQYEVARLDESKDSSIIQVLDMAMEPERKFKPKRLSIVLVSTMLAFFAAIALAFIREAKREALENPERAEQWDELKSHIRFK